MKLIWKSVLGHEGFYEVSGSGDVRSLTRSIAIVWMGNKKILTIRGKMLKGWYQDVGI